MTDTLRTAEAATTGADRWLTIVSTAAAAYQVLEPGSVTPQLVARRTGLPLEAVLEQFPGAEDLLVAVVQEWHAQRLARVSAAIGDPRAIPLLRALLDEDLRDPLMVRLMLFAASLASLPSHPMAPIAQHVWMRFHAHVQRLLIADRAAGREPDRLDPAVGAEQLMALYEGLQLQSLCRPGMDALAAFDRATGHLRDGWTAAHASPRYAI